MRTPRGMLILIALLFVVNGGEALVLDSVINIIKLGHEVIEGVLNTWMFIDNNNEDVFTSSMLNKWENKVLTQITEVSTRLAKVESLVQSRTMATVNELLRVIPGRVRLELQLHELSSCVSRVQTAHEQLSRYLKNGYNNETDTWYIERHTLEDFATSTVSHNRGSINTQLQRIHDIIASTAKGGLLSEGLIGKLADSVQDAESVSCNLLQSPQQMLYNLYNSVALAELKGYTMMQFSWMLLRLYNKGNFTREAELMHENYKDHTVQKLDAVQSAMKRASRQMWRCDPRVHTEGETYVQLTKLLQGHIQNEVDLNRDGTCRENCKYYSYAQSTGCFDQKTCSKMDRCNGRLMDCRYFDSDMWVCRGDRTSGRRFDWVEYENGRTLGRSGSCRSGHYKVDSWWRWVFWHCSYCFCLCDEQGPYSDRYINLRQVLSNTTNNMVVTGLRFVKVNRVVHMQIQEGSLLPRGGINASTVQWRPVDDYRISDSDVQNEKDFHTLTWEQRAIDLDDLEAPPGHVLTGFRFRNVGAHLNPEILVTPLNFSAGILIKPQEKSMWISNDNTDASYLKPRTQLNLDAPDVPTKSRMSSVPDSHSDQYMLFTHSDINSDAAQTTVPFIDAQGVAPNPPIPLSGAGIYHKGTQNFGGFIAPKVITYNLSPHMNAEFPSKT